MIKVDFLYYIDARFVLPVVFDIWTGLSVDDAIDVKDWLEKTELEHGQMTPSRKFVMVGQEYQFVSAGLESYCMITNEFSKNIAHAECSVVYRLKEV